MFSGTFSKKTSRTEFELVSRKNSPLDNYLKLIFTFFNVTYILFLGIFSFK